MKFDILAACLLGTLPLSLVCAASDASQTDLATVKVVASTVPANGDVNPYGVARVVISSGKLKSGHILVSNFNNSANLQGTGTTIVDISPEGNVSLFAQITADSLPEACPGGVGLTTALAVLRSGWVIVGSLPTTDGTAATAHAGCLIVLNNMGVPVSTIAEAAVNGPWDMNAVDAGDRTLLFVSNVLNGTVAASPNVVNEGTVIRIDLVTVGTAVPYIESVTTIGSGFPERTDPAALVIGPTGVGLDSNGTLYVADTLDNRIAAIPNAATRMNSAGTGTTVLENAGLNFPLGLAIQPKGGIATVNGANGLLILTTGGGNKFYEKLLDDTGTPPGAGALFGLQFAPEGLYFVDDASNTLNVLQ